MAEKAKADFLKADFKTLFQKKPKNTEEAAAFDPNNVPVYQPALPEVNLLPSNIREEYVAKELGGKFKIATIAIVAIFAVLGGVSFATSTMNQGKIDTITNETSAINSQVQQLAPFELYRTQVQSKRTQLGGAMGNDINYKALNDNFNAAAAASGFEVRSIKITSGGDQASGTAGNGACVNPDPFSSATGTGCITFGLAGNGNLANFFLELNKEDRGFINAYVPKANLGSANGETEKLVEGTVGFTDKYYSKKFSNLSAPIDTALDPNAAANPSAGQPSAQPSSAPSDGNSVDVSKLPEVTNK